MADEEKKPEKQTPPLTRCRWRTNDAKRAAIQDFLRKHGDNIPEATVREATTDEELPKWTALCDEEGIAGAMRWAKSDWYLCTLKNAATRDNLRGRGVGGKVYRRTMMSAIRATEPEGYSTCLVLAADVTWDNYGSKKLLEKMGFKTANRFCWGKGEKPADILHYVRIPPKHMKCGKDPLRVKPEKPE